MTNNPRYTLGTEANRIFMASETYELLKFGKGFPAPNGGSGWLNADGTLDPSHGVETCHSCPRGAYFRHSSQTCSGG